MALTIEIWRSTSGVSDGSFSLLTTLSDTGAGFSYDDAPVTYGSLYIYRARRRDDTKTGTACEYSAWSNLVFVRGPQPERNNPMAVNDILSGTDTELWVGVEGAEGIPTKAAWKAEYTQGGIQSDLMRVYGRTLRNTPTMRRKVVYGRATFQGDIELEVTPEGAFPRLMAATFPFVTTPLISPTRYRHRFRNLFGARTVTLIQRKGRDFYVYPGAKVNALEISCSVEQDSVLMARFSVTALDEHVYNIDQFNLLAAGLLTYLGTATASEDPLSPYSPVDGVSTIGGVTAGIRSITYSVNKGLLKENVMDGKRGVRQNAEVKNETSGSASLFFESRNNLLRDMTGSTTLPATGIFTAGSTIALAPVQTVFSPANNASGFSNVLGLYIPNCDIKTDQPVQGDGESPENLTFFPVDAVGDASGTDFYIEITNSETYTSLWTPNTPITQAPTSSVYTYEYCQAAAGSTTSSIIAGAVSAVGQWHLANQNATNYYTGRSLVALNGSNAGTPRTIGAYVGTPTPTFTLTSAFPNAVSAGDIFDIL